MSEQLIIYLLIFMRITAFVVTSPGLSIKNIPNNVKILLGLALTLGVSTGVEFTVVEVTSVSFVFYCMREILVGLALGFISRLIFVAIEIAGQLVDFQVGFSMASVYDPTTGVQASNYGRLFYWLALGLFFITDMHLVLIETLVSSFQLVPLASAKLTSHSVEGTMHLFVEVFKIGLGLAAPLIIVALIADIVLGIISRSVPQINVLMLGLPLKILASFVFMMLLLPILVENIIQLLPLVSQYVLEFIRSLIN